MCPARTTGRSQGVPKSANGEVCRRDVTYGAQAGESGLPRCAALTTATFDLMRPAQSSGSPPGILHLPSRHSSRKAAIGSSRAARRAGRNAAIPVAVPRSRAAIASGAGSYDLTP